ncbi:hypothetical protein ACFLVC_04575 [Chloroflexota bacterium]
MDRAKIEELHSIILKVDHEIDSGLRKTILGLHGNNWDQAPRLLDDCRYLMEQFKEAEGYIGKLRGSIMEMNTAAESMYREWQRTQAVSLPLTLGDHVKAIIEKFLEDKWEKQLLDVDDIREILETQGVYLGFKNPSAVLSSMLARDKRIKWKQPGLYEKGPDRET